MVGARSGAEVPMLRGRRDELAALAGLLADASPERRSRGVGDPPGLA